MSNTPILDRLARLAQDRQRRSVEDRAAAAAREAIRLVEADGIPLLRRPAKARNVPLRDLPHDQARKLRALAYQQRGW